MKRSPFFALVLLVSLTTTLFSHTALGIESLEGGSTCILVIDSGHNKENIISWGPSSAQAADSAFSLCYEKYGAEICNQVSDDQIYCRASNGFYRN